MAQDATSNTPIIASPENVLEQLKGSADEARPQGSSFFSQVTGNPLFTAVSHQNRAHPSPK